MNELKTLKDIDKVTILVPDVSKEQPDNYPLIPKVYVGYDELRQEAIKWIKSWLNTCLTGEKDYVEMMIEFFNITEEDFKNIMEKLK